MMTDNRFTEQDVMEKGLTGLRSGDEGGVSLEVEVLVSSPKEKSAAMEGGFGGGGGGGGARKSGTASAASGGSLPLEETNGEACRKGSALAARSGSATGSEKKAPSGGAGKPKGKGKKKKRRRSAAEVEEDKEGGERRKMVLVISVFAAGIFITAVLLIAITLRLSPAIDEKIRKENEQMMNSLNRASNNIVATENKIDGTEMDLGASDSSAAAVVTINASVMGTEERFGTSPSSSTKGTP